MFFGGTLCNGDRNIQSSCSCSNAATFAKSGPPRGFLPCQPS